MFIQWDFDKNTHIGAPSNVKGEHGVWLECILPKEPMTSAAQELRWLYLEGTHEDYLSGYWAGSPDPLDAPASQDLIRAKQLEFEVAPILVFGSMIDCDDRSEKLMRDALASWDMRAMDGEWFATSSDGLGNTVLKWKLADNTTREFTFAHLTALFNTMLAARAVRGQQLWIAAQKFKVNPPTVREVNSIDAWLEAA